MKNAVPPNIHSSYDHRELNLLRRKKRQHNAEDGGHQTAGTGQEQRRSCYTAPSPDFGFAAIFSSAPNIYRNGTSCSTTASDSNR